MGAEQKIVQKKREQKTEEKKKQIIIVAVAVLVVLIGAVVVWSFLPKNESAAMKIKTTYLTVQYPKEYEKYLKYEELVQGKDATVVFTMIYDEVEAELFRLSFTEAAPEEYAGYFAVDNGELYVSIKASGFNPMILGMDQSDEASEKRLEIESLYYSMLDGMTTVMGSVREDSRFSEIRGASESEKKELSLSYWNVSLPQNITCVETEQDGIYRATFKCHVGDKEIDLYTVCLGDSEVESVIGQFATNGRSRLISVELHELNADTLSQEELEIVYAMMDTINDVLQAIRQDKNFSEQTEPAAYGDGEA